MVPATLSIEKWVPSVGKILDRLKSASLALKFSFNKIFVVFTSLWIIGGLQPLCKYSNPTFHSKKLFLEKMKHS